MPEKNWFVFYTKSRQEKAVNDLLARHGFEPYLPTQHVIRQWSDRKKKVNIPLFNSYIFVRIAEHQVQNVLTIPGIAWSVRYDGKPATVRDSEIDLIKRFIASGLFIDTASSANQTFKEGDKARIVDGPLAGLVGILSSEPKDRKFIVEIESIQQVLRVQIPAFLLQKV